MAALSVDEKKTRGAAINVAKQAIEAALTARRQQLADDELAVQLRAEALDVSLPGRRRVGGGLHPVSRTLERIEAIFSSMGFDVADGPEVESDWHSFTSLNNPPNHPARSMQDTFYVDIDGEDGVPTTCVRTPARCRCAMRTSMSRSTPRNSRPRPPTPPARSRRPRSA